MNGPLHKSLVSHHLKSILASKKLSCTILKLRMAP